MPAQSLSDSRYRQRWFVGGDLLFSSAQNGLIPFSMKGIEISAAIGMENDELLMRQFNRGVLSLREKFADQPVLPLM
jgi:hypothetical protein